jgi:hypothetical protein
MKNGRHGFDSLEEEPMAMRESIHVSLHVQEVEFEFEGSRISKDCSDENTDSARYGNWPSSVFNIPNTCFDEILSFLGSTDSSYP